MVQVLFRTIPKEEEDALRLRYAGTQAERSSAAKGKKPSDKGMPFLPCMPALPGCLYVLCAYLYACVPWKTIHAPCCCVLHTFRKVCSDTTLSKTLDMTVHCRADTWRTSCEVLTVCTAQAPPAAAVKPRTRLR